MRPLELLIAIASVSYLFCLSFGSGLANPVVRALPFVALLFVALHLITERYRWHMIPVYALVALILFSYPWCNSHHFRIRLTYLAIGWAVAFVLLSASAITAGVIYPVFEFTSLTGQYAVGTVSEHLIDSQRIDPYAGTPAAKRELMVQVWYPAATTRGYARAMYRDGRTSGWRDSNLALVKTRSFVSPPISRSQPRYPVLIFSGPFNRFQNTFETEELASHGFIVVGVDHPYDSDLVVFPDGRRIRVRKANTFLDFASAEALRESTREVEFDLKVRVADIQLVLDQLKIWDSPDPAVPFSGCLDLARIGMFGHSFGGAVAAEVARRDPRIRAVINMDGWMFGESGPLGVPKPAFFMVDCTPRPTPAELSSGNEESRLVSHRIEQGYQDIERSMSRYGGDYLQVPGLEHMNYSDGPLHSQLKMRTGAGAIDARRAHELVDRLSLAFFQRSLLGETQASLHSIAAEFPEAKFQEVPAKSEAVISQKTAEVGH